VLAKLGGESTQGGFIDIDRASEDELRTVIATNKGRLTSARNAFFLPHIVPVDYTSTDLIGFESLNKFRQLQRLFDFEGRLAILDGRPDDATTSYLDEMRLGSVVGQGGLQIDEMVGRAIENVGLYSLCEIRKSVSPKTSRQVIETVQTLDDECEPFAVVEKREAVWQQHAYGWAGRIVLNRENESAEARRVFAEDSNARRRLLICDLAIRLYQAEYGKLPERLEQLAPEYLRELPIDPFSGRPPVYRPRGEAAFLLYSIGPDGNDDGGMPTEKDNLLGDGDLVLDP
jgi:hypothetical protein